MFKPKNIHNGIQGLAIGTRLVFKKPPENKEAPVQAAEEKMTPAEYRALLEKGVDYKESGVHDTIKALAEKIYGNTDEGKRWAAERTAAWDEALELMKRILTPENKKKLDEDYKGSMKQMADDDLKRIKCKTLALQEKDNKVTFKFIGAENFSWPPEGVAIKALPVLSNTTTETTKEQQNALEIFKKEFPDQANKVRLGRTAIGEGSVARIPNVRNLPIYTPDTEKPKKTISTDQLGEFQQSDAVITKSFTIIAPNDIGGTSEYVYIETRIVGSLNARSFQGWVERSRLSDVNITKPEEKVAITVDEKKVGEEKEARKKAEEKKEQARQAKEGFLDEEGIVHFTNPDDTKKISLNTLFPEAVEGDSVQVTHKIGSHMETATYNAEKKDWLNEKKKHVPVYNGDKVVKTSNIGAALEQATAKPVAPILPPELKLLDTEPRQLTPEQARSTNWNDIAKALIAEKKEIKDTGIKPVDYAKLLKQYASDTGYYWVILPQKVKPAAADEAAKEIAAGHKRAEARDKKAAPEREKKTIAAYDKWKNILWENRTIWTEKAVGEEINAVINDQAKWKEACTRNYPINWRLIEEGFQRPPYNNVPETARREGVRKLLYTSIVSNRFSFSDFFEIFNKQGEIYKYLGERPGDLDDLKKEYQLVNETVPEKARKNKENQKALNYDFSEDEEKVFKKYWSYTDRANELRDVVMGAALIAENVTRAMKTKAEAPEWMRSVPQYKVTERDQQFGEAYRNTIWQNEDVETRDSIDEILSDEKKWADFWEHDKGNVLILKKALQRPPFNRLQGAEKMLIRKAVHDSMSKNDINMSNILDYLNPDGLIYKNRDGEQGDLDDFKNEYWEEQVGYKIKSGKTVTAAEQQMYDNHPKKSGLGNRYKELAELFVSSSYVLDAVKNLDPESSYSESVPANERPRAMLDEAFPPTDAGSINGVPQDYSDTYGEDGYTRVAGGGLFTGGLFKYDFRDRFKGIADFDLITSHSTANRIIFDQCQTDGKLDVKKLQYRLNELIRLGINSLLAEPDSDQKAKALQAIGITDKELASADPAADVAKRMAVNFEKGNSLTAVQKDMVRMGFIIETVGRPGEVAEVVEWSEDPKVRALQETALKLGAKPEAVSHMDQDIIASIHGALGKNFDTVVKEAGLTVPIKLAGKGHNAVYLALNGAYDFAENRFIFRAGIGGQVEVAKNFCLFGGIGATSEGRFVAGGGVNWYIPVDEKTIWEPNMIIGAGISTDFKGLDATVGAALMWSRSGKKQFEADFRENLEKAGYKAVEEAKDTKTKAEALRNLPGASGKALYQLQRHLKLDDEGLVQLYENHLKKKIEQSTAQAGLGEHKFLGFLPPVVKAGFGLGLQFSTDEPWTFIPGVACAVSIGSELIVFQRPVSSTEQMIAGGEAQMEKQAEDRIRSQKAFEATAKKAGYTNITFADTLVGDMESGLRPVKQEKATVSSRPTLNPVDAELEKVFGEFQKELLAKGLQLDKVGNLYRLRVLNVGNYQFYVDPQMKERIGAFVNDGDIFISANRNPKLVIKRLDNYYPRPKDGNIKHTIVTISDEDFRTVSAIKAESDFFLDSRTKDNTGTERTKLALNRADSSRPAKQFNLRAWNQAESKRGGYAYFDTLDTTTADMVKYREFAKKQQKYGEIAAEVRNNIGQAELESVDINRMHAFAMDFMKKHPVIYRKYTTSQIKSEPELLRLNEQIRKDFKEATDKDMSEDELTVAKEEMFNLSMTEAEKKVANLPENKRIAAKRELLRQKIDWMRDSIYVPLFRKLAVGRFNPKNFTPEQLAEAFIAPLRQMSMTSNFDNAEDIAVGASTKVAVGSEKIVGQRGIVAGRKPGAIADHRLFVGKDYSQALVTGQPEIDHAIALCFRESQRPIERLKTNEFLSSPLAIKLLLLGTENGNPTLIKALGEENYRRLSDCYIAKPPTAWEDADAQTREAITKLSEIGMKLNEAQEGKGTRIEVTDRNGSKQVYYSINVNGVILGIRTVKHQSGVYQRCLNAAQLYDEEIIALSEEEIPTPIPGAFRSYDAKSANSLTSSFAVRGFAIGIGVIGPFGPTAPPPPGGENPAPEPEKGVSLGGGVERGGVHKVTPGVESGGAGE